MVLLCEAVLSFEHLKQHVMRYGVECFHNVDEDDVCVAPLHRGECPSRAFSARCHQFVVTEESHSSLSSEHIPKKHHLKNLRKKISLFRKLRNLGIPQNDSVQLM